MPFKVSVIMPVYNAEKYISKAIGSAILQKEVGEIIIVDDGSTDNSLNICKNFALTDSRIKVFQHPDCKNHGRSATRNLAINKATCDFIAFLDADDFFLDNRFTNDKEIIEKDKTVDGVYNAIGAHFYRNPYPGEEINLKLTTVTREVDPEELFYKILKGDDGYFSCMGLTVKKQVFEKVGLFDEALEVSEDTLLVLKLALLCKLVPGILNSAVANRGIHTENVFNIKSKYTKSRKILSKKLLKLGIENSVNNETLFVIYGYLLYLINSEGLNFYHKIVKELYWWFILLLNRFRLLTSITFIKKFPIISVLIAR